MSPQVSQARPSIPYLYQQLSSFSVSQVHPSMSGLLQRPWHTYTRTPTQFLSTPKFLIHLSIPGPHLTSQFHPKFTKHPRSTQASRVRPRDPSSTPASRFHPSSTPASQFHPSIPVPPERPRFDPRITIPPQYPRCTSTYNFYPSISAPPRHPSSTPASQFHPSIPGVSCSVPAQKWPYVLRVKGLLPELKRAAKGTRW